MPRNQTPRMRVSGAESAAMALRVAGIPVLQWRKVVQQASLRVAGGSE